MESNEIIEGNKMIAEFMEFPVFMIHDELIWYDHDGAREVKYPTSWDWIMPVCYKIQNKKYHILVDDSITPYINACKLFKNGLIRANIDVVYSGVIKFIKWYNTQKNDNGK